MNFFCYGMSIPVCVDVVLMHTLICMLSTSIMCYNILEGSKKAAVTEGNTAVAPVCGEEQGVPESSSITTTNGIFFRVKHQIHTQTQVHTCHTHARKLKTQTCTYCLILCPFSPQYRTKQTKCHSDYSVCIQCPSN